MDLRRHFRRVHSGRHEVRGCRIRGKSVGIVGSGPVGLGLATLPHRAGRRVVVGTGHPEAAKLRGLPSDVGITDFRGAAGSDIVILSVRHAAGRALAGELRSQLSGKVIIDTMNPWIRADYVAAGMSGHASEGAWLADLLPGSMISRAFSHIDWGLLVPYATGEPGKWAAGYAGDAPEAIDVTSTVIEEAGYVPYFVGGLAESASLDLGGSLWAEMFTSPQMVDRLRVPAGRGHTT